jgi:hypothetical protein
MVECPCGLSDELKKLSQLRLTDFVVLHATICQIKTLVGHMVGSHRSYNNFNVFSCVPYPCARSQGVNEFTTKLEALDQAAPEDHNHMVAFPNVGMDQDIELNRMITLILSNSFHLIIGLNLTLIQNEF